MQNGHNGEGNGGFAIVNSASRVVTGQWVAHTQRTLHERAFEAADLVNGVSLLIRPTASQSALLGGSISRTSAGRSSARRNVN
jgi:hypothetical protein